MKAKLPLIIAGLSALTAPLHAQVAFDGDYSQDFNTLVASPATGNSWANNSTLAGWYSSSVVGGQTSSYNASSGTATAGSLYSFGASGNAERAMGSISSAALGAAGQPALAFGVRLQNNSAMTFENFTVSYAGEQWRNNGNATQQSLSFWYQVGTGLTDTTPGSNAAWTALNALDFTGPIATATAVSLDGNALANRINLSATLSGVSLAPGQELFLRWLDLNDAGNDHGLAIDNFNVTALTVVPEPSTWALLGGGLLFLAHRLRRRN